MDEAARLALAGLAPHLSESLKDQVLREALAAVQEIETEWGRAETLAELAPRLAELGRPDEALAGAR